MKAQKDRSRGHQVGEHRRVEHLERARMPHAPFLAYAPLPSGCPRTIAFHNKPTRCGLL